MQKIHSSNGTDYLYEKHGKKWRVRVRVNSELPTDAPINGDTDIEAAGYGLSVSVALLNDDDTVAVDPLGRYRVFPAHVLTIQNEALGVIDPQAEIEKVIDQQLDVANNQLQGKNAVYEVLAQYA